MAYRAVVVLALAALAGLAASSASAAPLSSAAGVRIDGRLWRQHAGAFVAAAGDVNGDGLADMLVGTRETHRSSRSTLWNAYIVFGRRGPHARHRVVRLDRLGRRGLRIVTHAAPGFVAGDGAGDLNGDGVDDVVLGAPGATAYVVYGRRGAGGTVDADRLGGRGFVVRGARLGETEDGVAGVGDLDGDGFDDIAIGDSAYVPAGGQFGTGRVVVVFGARRTGAALRLTRLGRRGATVIGPGPFQTADGRLASVGFGHALDGAGAGQVVIGAPWVAGRLGAAYVVRGLRRRGALVDLRAGGAAARTLLGEGNQGFGWSVAGAGDLDRDGRPDIVVGELAGGQLLASSFGPSAAFVFGASWRSALRDDVGGDRAGYAVAGGADLTGDGVGDVVVGAPLADPGGIDRAGAAFVVPGAAWPAQLDLRGAAGVRRLDGDARLDTAGSAVAALGDVNGDGRADLAVAAPRTDRLAPESGSVYLVYGSA